MKLDKKMFLSLAILFFVGLLAYYAGSFFSSKKKSNLPFKGDSQYSFGMDATIFKDLDVPKRNPEIRGRIISVAEDSLVISYSKAMNNTDDRENRRTEMQKMSESEREKMRETRMAQREENTEKRKIYFSEETKIWEIPSGEASQAKKIQRNELTQDENTFLWIQEGSSDKAEALVVNKREIKK
ncbi:MAG: hypothetical protein IPN70_04555 [Candidatus Moraniibacteriota bacterium]|nr:MAG: hypothetical protein IPN70_04555 [Candidatus Moranbacteria bacterium]